MSQEIDNVLKRALVLDTECVVGDTLVQTSDGNIIEIQNLSDQSIWATEHVDFRKPAFSNSHSLVKKENLPCYQVKCNYGLPIEASENHLFLTDKGWKKTVDLTQDDYLLLSTDFPDGKENPELTDTHVDFLGWFLAEGSRSEKNTTIFTCAEKDYVDVFPNPWPDLVKLVWSGGKCLRASLIEMGRSKDGAYRKNPAGAFLKRCGVLNKYSYEKIIPAEVLSLPKRQLARLIAAMWAGDGTIFKDRLGLAYTTTSKRLAEQLVLLLCRFGILSYLFAYEDTRKDTYKIQYTITISGYSAIKFLEVIPLSGRKGEELRFQYSKCTRRIPQDRIPASLMTGWQEKYENYVLEHFPALYKRRWRFVRNLINDDISNVIYQNVGIPRSLLVKLIDIFPDVFSCYKAAIIENTIWIKVKSVKFVGNKDVYDVTVSNAEFFANGILVHNTLSLRKGAGLHELALFDPESNEIREFFLSARNNQIDVSRFTRQEFTRLASNQHEMYTLVQANSWRELMGQDLAKKGLDISTEDAFRESLKKDNIFAYHSYMGSKHKHLQGYTYTEADRVATEQALGSTIIRKQNVDLLDLVKEGGELDKLMQGRTVWVANLKFDCVSGDTLLQLEDGNLIEIKDFNGGIVWGSRDKGAEAVLVKAKNAINKGLKHCYEIVAQHGIPIKASDNHAFLTQRGWILTKDLQVGDWLFLFNQSYDLPESKLWDDELDFLGWYVSEGSRCTKGSVSISNYEQEYVDLFPNPWPSDLRWQHDSAKGHRNHRLAGNKPGIENPAATFLKRMNLLDKYSFQKFIPTEVLQSSNRQIGIFLASLYAGDGHISWNSIVYTTTSELLAKQLCLVLLRMGIVSSYLKVPDEREAHYHTCYRIECRGEAIEEFAKKIPLFARKRREIDVLIEKRKQRKQIQSIYRIPVSYNPDLLDRWKEFVRSGFEKQATRKPMKQYLRQVCKVNTDGVYDGNSDTWSREALENLSRLENFNWIQIPKGLHFTKISEIQDIGEIEVFDIETETEEFVGNGIVVHNSSQLGARMGYLGQQRFEQSIGPNALPEHMRSPGPMLTGSLETLPQYTSESLLGTGLEYNRARVYAQSSGDWSGVWKAAIAPIKEGETATRDIQDLTRSIMSYGQQLGFLNKQNEYLGASVDLQYRFLHLLEQDQDVALKGFLTGELHQASSDTKQEFYVLRKSLEMLERLDQLKGMSAYERQQLAMAAGENSDFHRITRYFGAMKEISLTLQQISINERMIRAVQDIQEQGFTSQIVSSRISSRTNTELATGTDVEIPVMSHQRKEMSFDEFTGFLKNSKYFAGFDTEASVQAFRDFVEVEGKVDLNKLLEFQQTQTRSLQAKLFEGDAGKVLFGKTVNRSHVAQEMFRAGAGQAASKLADLLPTKGIAAVGVGAIAAVGALSLLPDHSEEYKSLTHQNYAQWEAMQPQFPGMSEQGLSAQTRKFNTDFGSPYKGPEVTQQVLADQELLREREKFLRQRYGIKHSKEPGGLFDAFSAFGRWQFRRPGFSFLQTEKYEGNLPKKGLRQIDLSGYKISSEDADTITVQRGGLTGFIGGILGLNTRYNFRLAGIDSPETSHGLDSYHAPQPGAEEGGVALQFMLANTKNLSVVVDPTQITYGRMLGAVVADGKVLNYELVKQGQAAYLPYGKHDEAMVDYGALKRMEGLAHGSRMGIWKTPWAMAYFDGMEGAGDRITFNTLTDKGKIAESGTRMSLLTMMETAQSAGMYNAAMATEMAQIGAKIKQDNFKPDYSTPFMLEHSAGSTNSYQAQMARELAGFIRTKGTNQNPNMFQVRSTMKLDSYMALDSMSTTNSIWTKRRMGTFKMYGVDKDRMAEAQKDVNHSIFASGIGHTVW